MAHAPRHGPGSRAVLLVLAWHADPAGRGAWPSRATIAREAGGSERQVGDALKVLEREGSIARDGNRPGGGTVIWRIVLDVEERRAKAATAALRKAMAA